MAAAAMRSIAVISARAAIPSSSRQGNRSTNTNSSNSSNRFSGNHKPMMACRLGHRRRRTSLAAPCAASSSEASEPSEPSSSSSSDEDPDVIDAANASGASGTSSSSSSSSKRPAWSPPPGRLDETAARDRVLALAAGTAQGAGALEAVQGVMSSLPNMKSSRLMLFRYPGLKCPLDTVALNLMEPRWVVAFDMLANAPRPKGDPPFCFGITHPALTPARTPRGENAVPPKPGDVGLICEIVDVYHDNKEERMYMTSRVVGRYKVDRVVGEHPFYVAETSQVLDLPETDKGGEEALLEAEMRVWRLLQDLDALSAKTGEGGKQIDFDMQRLSPDPKARPAWDSEPPPADRRAELFSWAVIRRLGLDQRQHLDAVRSVYTTARLGMCEAPLQEGVNYLAACASIQSATSPDPEAEAGGDSDGN